MANLDYYLTEYSGRISRADNEDYKIPDSVPDVRNMINDHKVMALAKDLEKKIIGDVVIIHDDVDFSVHNGKTMRIDDYVAKRSKLIDYTSIIDLDLEFDHLEYFQRIVSTLDLNAYLPDGMTLLISTIKCNDLEKIEERGGRRIPDQKVIKKVKFLLENGADPLKNDNGRYCLPPLAHSIQTREYYGFDIFKLLLDAGCDFNKAARDERTASYAKYLQLDFDIKVDGFKTFRKAYCTIKNNQIIYINYTILKDGPLALNYSEFRSIIDGITYGDQVKETETASQTAASTNKEASPVPDVNQYETIGIIARI